MTPVILSNPIVHVLSRQQYYSASCFSQSVITADQYNYVELLRGRR